MRYSASEKLEIIELVEQSTLSVGRTLASMGSAAERRAQFISAIPSGAMSRRVCTTAASVTGFLDGFRNYSDDGDVARLDLWLDGFEQVILGARVQRAAKIHCGDSCHGNNTRFGNHQTCPHGAPSGLQCIPATPAAGAQQCNHKATPLSAFCGTGLNALSTLEIIGFIEGDRRCSVGPAVRRCV